MADKPKRGIGGRIANASLAGIGKTIADRVYRANRERAIAEVARDVGAKVASIEAIAERKAYEQIGGTEVGSFLNSAFTDQPPQNLQTLASLYEIHPWVKICASYISGALSGVPLRVWRATGYEDGKEIMEPADDSPVGRMFRWINPMQSPSEFIEELCSWMILCGEGYVVYAKPGPGTPKGIPAEMYVLLTPFVEKLSSPTLGIRAIRYTVGGQSAVFDSTEFSFFRMFSPAGRFRGQAAATAGFETIQADQQMREFNRNILRQGVHLSGILSTESDEIGRDDAEAMRQDFETRYSGSNKAAKIAVLWGGLKFSPTTILQKDIMMSEQATAHRDEIIALFGLKPELLSEKFANKATAETVRRMAYEDTILGRWGQRIESVFSSTGLMRFDPDLRAKFDTRNVPALQTSATERVDVATKSVAGGLMTVNQARESLLSLPVMEVPEADILTYQGRPLASLMSGPAPGDKPAKGTGAFDVLARHEQKFGVVVFKADNTALFEQLKRRSFAKTEAEIRRVLRELQAEMRSATSASTVDSGLMIRLEQIFAHDGRNVLAASVGEAISESIAAAVDIEFARLTTAGIVGTFDIKPVRALARLGSQQQRIRDMMGRNWTDLRTSLQEGLSLGETSADLNARVSQFFDGMRNNAETIAVTEINPAINGATMDVAIAAVKAGADIISTWKTMEDDLVRTPPKSKFDHQKANGLTIIPGKELFVVSGERMEYPGDSWNGASPGNTIGCRCGIENEVREPNASDNRGDL